MEEESTGGLRRGGKWDVAASCCQSQFFTHADIFTTPHSHSDSLTPLKKRLKVINVPGCLPGKEEMPSFQAIPGER